MSVLESIRWTDHRNSIPLADGQVLWTLPADSPPLKSWNIAVYTVRCGGRWSKSPTGCGVEIAYRADATAPTTCELCGGTDLPRCDVRGLIGLGPEPGPGYRCYDFHNGAFDTRRSIMGMLVARRRVVETPYREFLTLAARGLLSMWRAEG